MTDYNVSCNNCVFEAVGTNAKEMEEVLKLHRKRTGHQVVIV